jgi:hypothetical protein
MLRVIPSAKTYGYDYWFSAIFNSYYDLPLPFLLFNEFVLTVAFNILAQNSPTSKVGR